jgi:cyclopropane fatty-acyl-phospholipid synthase-like methyltransferase
MSPTDQEEPALAETEEYARQYFIKQRASNREYWRRFGASPDWDGKRVLEVGCGHGAMSIELAEAGAMVHGVDLDEFRVFQAVDATSLPSDRLFDAIVSKDTFEHVEDLASLLKGLGQRLAPGGLIYAGFSPLYYSPRGDHGRTGLKVPWAHAMLPKSAVCAAAARHNGHPVRTLVDIGLNGNTPDQYRAAFEDSGLRLRDIGYNRGDKPLLAVLEKARGRFPRFDRFTTVSIYAVLAA